jgi:outer membrane protein OmpA-like peptidoglycan-associated protein
MKTIQILSALGLALLASACATPPKDIASVDTKIADATQGDFGQFLLHQSLAEENLAHLRKVRQYWQNDHYWNIEFQRCVDDAAAKAAEHRKMAEEALIRWHDNCQKHQDICRRLDALESMHAKKAWPVAYFDTGEAIPKSLQKDHIDAVLRMAHDSPGMSLDVVGMTDTVGKSQDNHGLAQRRARAVHNILMQQGLPASVSVHELAKGEVPGPDNTPSAQNRRVEVLAHGHHGYWSEQGMRHGKAMQRRHRRR